MWLRCAASSFGRWRYCDSDPPSCRAARPRYRHTRWFFKQRRHDVPDPGGLMPLFRVLDSLSVPPREKFRVRFSFGVRTIRDRS